MRVLIEVASVSHVHDMQMYQPPSKTRAGCLEAAEEQHCNRAVLQQGHHCDNYSTIFVSTDPITLQMQTSS